LVYNGYCVVVRFYALSTYATYLVPVFAKINWGYGCKRQTAGPAYLLSVIRTPMGGHPSRPQASATELLQYACEVAIASNAACISQAQATIAINIAGAANVTFKNDDLSAVATATEDCSQSVNINVPSMQAAVEQAVKEVAGTTISSGPALTKLSSTVSKTMNQKNVQKAIADALNSFQIALKATGNVDVVNLNVSQVATSNLNNIVQNMSVNGESPNTVAKDLQKQLDEVMAEVTPCPQPSSVPSANVHYASYAGLVLILILLICSFVFLKQSPLL
jgi:hypothetical protein